MFVVARDEERPDDKYKQCVWEIEDGGIEHGIVAEDGCHDRISDETDIAECDHKSVEALIVIVNRHVSWDDEGDENEKSV